MRAVTILLVVGFLCANTMLADSPPDGNDRRNSSATKSTPKNVTHREAVEIAKKQLISARPELEILRLVEYGDPFIHAGPGSGGGPKWVIGFETKDKGTGKKWIYYVTVFPDGSTSEKEIRPGAFS